MTEPIGSRREARERGRMASDILPSARPPRRFRFLRMPLPSLASAGPAKPLAGWPASPPRAPRPPLKPHTYVDPALAVRRDVVSVSTPWVVLLIAAMGDAANFYLALATVADQMNAFSLVSTIAALTVVAVATMHAVGVSSRQRRADARRAGTGVSVAVATVLWLALGLAAFFLRVSSPEQTTSELGSSSFSFGDGTATSTAADSHVTLLLSFLMLALYVATGAMAAWFAYHGHNPFYTAWRRATRERFRVETQLQKQRGRVSRYNDLVTLLEEELEREGQRLESERTECAALGLELKELARNELAKHLGDPASTSALTSTDLPSPRSATSASGSVYEGIRT